MFQRKDFEASMAEEMRQHLELREKANRESGMSPQDAHYAAQRSFGGIEQLKEIAREERGWRWLDELVQDLRYGARKLRTNFRFTLIVGLTLAVCIGINTVVFTFYNAIVLKPLPVRAPHELVRLTNIEGSRSDSRFTFSQFETITNSASTLTAVIAISSPETARMQAGGSSTSKPDIVSIRFSSENFFSALGISPALGQFFTTGKKDGAVLSDEFWRRQFSADPSVAGKTIMIEGIPVTVLGVAPYDFAGTGLPAQAPDLWLPLSIQQRLMPKSDWFHGERKWQILARRNPTATLEKVSSELQKLAHNHAGGGDNPQRKIVVKSATLFPTDTGEFQAFKTITPLVMVAVGSLLLIGCANVINMLAARNAARSHEFAVRQALGASRARLIQQLCTESALLGIIGGAGGILLSFWFSEIARVWIIETFRRLTGSAQAVFINVTPDWRVFTYTAGLSVFTGILVGIWPAWRTTRRNLSVALKEALSATGSSSLPWRKRNFLLGVQMAASLVMLALAGLLFRGATQSRRLDPGFEIEHLVTVNLDLQAVATSSADQGKVLGSVAARLRQLPSVMALSWAEHPPFMGHAFSGFTNEKHIKESWAINGVADNYFSTVGLPLVAGRPFTSEEVESGSPVAVINETAAQHLSPNKSALGEHLVIPRLPPLTVVGVVKNGPTVLITKQDGPDLYYPRPIKASGVVILIRSRTNAEGDIESLTSAIGEVDEDLLRRTHVMTLQDGPIRIQQLMSEAPAVVATTLGVIALILASAGIYGVVSFGVAQRKREIGIRMALGATSRDVICMVVRQTLQPVVWGSVLGLLGAIGVSILFKRLLSNPEIPDLTYAAGGFPVAIFMSILGALVIVVLLAAAFPVRRATKMDPMDALRTE